MACEEGSIAIPQDMIINILYHVPAKSVGRFRSVSKEWLYICLLSEPQFIKTHQKTLNRNHLICWNNSSYVSVPFDNHEEVSTLTKFPYESCDIAIKGSCNGLVLASAYDFHDVVCNFYLINLNTRDYVEFPVWRHDFSDDLGKCSMIGFGYDYVKDDYKVVTISYLYTSLPYGIRDETYYVHVYSLRNNTWKQVSDSPYDHYSNGRAWVAGVYVNGFPHWIANKGSDRIPVIVAFCLADEKFSEVPSPDWKNEADILSRSDSNPVALGDKLAIFHSLECVVWLMNEYGVKESWKKIVVCGFDNKTPPIEPGIFYNNGKLVVVTHNIVMMIYDLKQQTFCKSTEIDIVNFLWAECAYVESLVSPKLLIQSNSSNVKSHRCKI